MAIESIKKIIFHLLSLWSLKSPACIIHMFIITSFYAVVCQLWGAEEGLTGVLSNEWSWQDKVDFFGCIVDGYFIQVPVMMIGTWLDK